MKRKIKKAKPVVRRKKKIMYKYKCIANNRSIRQHVGQEINAHGAYNNKIIDTVVHIIQFMYLPNVPTYTPLPEVVSSTYELVTTSKEIADKYEVGEEYSELPR